MTNFTAARTGNISGDATAIFLKVFPGEVLTALKRATFWSDDKQMVRTIQNGKSAQFPAHGRLTAAYHTPGVTLTGQSITNGEKLISIDGVLAADAFHADIDEAMTHYDQRSVIATELGEAMARTYDLNCFRTAILAARSTDANPSGNNGNRIANADLVGDGTPSMLTETSALREAFFKAAQLLDEDFVPDYDDRHGVLRPAQYYLLAQDTTVLNKDWNGSGSYSRGAVDRIANIMLHKNNNMLADDTSDGTDADGNAVLSKYRVNASNNVGLIFNNRAIGTVKLMDLSVRRDYMPRELGTFMVAKQATGHGILRPECVVELYTS